MAGKASGKTVERLVVVDETQADRQTIEIYELVTRKMRVGRVPLLFKALAAEKALMPCWQALRPAIRVRAFEEAADDLRARAARSAVDLGCPLIETQLEWAGYDVDEIDQIRGQVDIFHYVDAKLLMATCVLAEALRGGCGGGRCGSAGGRAATRSGARRGRLPRSFAPCCSDPPRRCGGSSLIGPCSRSSSTAPSRRARARPRSGGSTSPRTSTRPWGWTSR